MKHQRIPTNATVSNVSNWAFKMVVYVIILIIFVKYLELLKKEELRVYNNYPVDY